jgi:polyketide synthase PksJ
LQELRGLGAEVLALQADVEDREAMDAALQAAQERFGVVHGVLHAAGVAGGGLIQLKEPEQASRVLGPKVRGTLILEQLLRSRPPLDFFVVFSSITAVAGGVGQVDYCAANAFCDAFMTSLARDPQRDLERRGTYYLSVGWDRWQQVGMAVRSDLPGLTPPPGLPKTLLDGLRTDADAGKRQPAHPLLDRRLEASDTRWVFASELSPEKHWVLSEHLIVGQPTLPGTTYLEMVRGALEEIAAETVAADGSGVVEIREVAFLAPLAVPVGQRRLVLTVLEANGDSSSGGAPAGGEWAFRVLSAEPQATAGFRWQEHARGRGARVDTAVPERVEVETVHQRCDGRRLRPGDGDGVGAGESAAGETVEASPFLVTGGRWQCLEVLREGGEVSLAELSLSVEQEPALESYGLHPSLLDVATGSVQFLHEGDFLPLAYQRLTFFAPLTRRVFSLLRQRPAGGAGGEGVGGSGDEQLLTCDIQLLDADGEVLVAVQGFSMRRISAGARRQLEALEQAAGASPEEHGIRPEEGVEVLRRLLLGGTEPHVVVSTRDLPAVLRSLDEVAVDETPATAGGSYARPELESEYVAPADDLQGAIAAVWQRVLGVEKVGIYDNFFELGGTSLNGIQLAAELKRELGQEIPTVTIFEAPTVAALARFLQPQDRGPSLGERSEERAERKKAALAAQRRPRRR